MGGYLFIEMSKEYHAPKITNTQQEHVHLLAVVAGVTLEALVQEQ